MVEGNSKEEEEVEEPEDFCLGLLRMEVLVSLRPDPNNKLFALYEAAISIKTTTKCKDIKCDSKEAEETVEEFNAMKSQLDDMYVQHPELRDPNASAVYARGSVDRAVALGCCDYPCPDRVKVKIESLSGRIPGLPPSARGGLPLYTAFEFEDVLDIIKSEFGLGGKNPPTFRPCCKKKKAAEAGTPGAI